MAIPFAFGFAGAEEGLLWERWEADSGITYAPAPDTTSAIAVAGMNGVSSLLIGNAASVPTAPTVEAAPTGFNGHPAFFYQGGQWMTANGMAPAFSGEDVPLVAMSVFRLATTLGNRYLMWMGDTAGASLHTMQLMQIAAYRTTRRGNSDGGGTNVEFGLINTTVTHIWEQRFNANGDAKLSAWLDGALTLDEVALDLSSAVFNRLWIGARRNGGDTTPADQLSARVAGVAFGTMTDTERTDLRATWASKYAVTV